MEKKNPGCKNVLTLYFDMAYHTPENVLLQIAYRYQQQYWYRHQGTKKQVRAYDWVELASGASYVELASVRHTSQKNLHGTYHSDVDETRQAKCYSLQR